MRIRRVRLRQYRGIADRTITLPARGVTIIEGPNETGKTSLAEAISLIFDLPDTTQKQVVRELQPAGRDTGTEVEVEVESGPYRFTLAKRFNKDRETTLHVAAPRVEQHTGREAHERARAILDETIDVALWRALCIQQGDGLRQADVAVSRSLVAALDAAAGGVPRVGDAELGLLARVTDEYHRYFTDRGGDGRALRDSAHALAAAEAAVRVGEERLAEIERDVERAAALDGELHTARQAAADSDTAAAQTESARRDAEARAGDIERLAAASAAAALSAAEAEREWTGRQQQIAEVERLAAERSAHAAAAAAAAEQVIDAEHEQARAARDYDELAAAVDRANSLLALRRADVDDHRQRAALQTLQVQRERIGAALTAAAHARESLGRQLVDDAALSSIRALDVAVREARAALEAGSPGVAIQFLAAGTVASADGVVEHRAGTEVVQRAVDPLTVAVPGALEVVVTPGRGAHDLAAAHAHAQHTFEIACKAAGVADLSDAERAARATATSRQALADAERVVEEHLGGRRLDDLDEELAWLARITAEHTDQRPGLPAPAITLDDAVREAAAAEDVARDLAARVAAADARRAATRQASDTARARAQREAALAEMAGVREEEASAALVAARARIADDEVPLRLNAARAAATEAAEALDAARAAHAGTDVAAASALAANAAALQRAARDRLRRLEDERRDVATRLLLRGEEGRYEALEEARSQKAALERSNRSLLARAAAVRLLHDTLIDCRDDARASYQEPLRDAIDELGRVLYGPTFSVELDDQLQIARRVLHGVALPFHVLSAGAREQLALLGRLACAMLVSPDGGVPLILDDTLGASDPQRLERMGAVLRLAGEHCQVLVLTCTPQRFGFVGGANIVQLVA
jgi:DNA repair exonuclease SbcCD ATPase subunit